MKTTTIITGREGFTLIEIIAVLMLLGILSTVAAARYHDFTDEAKDKAAEGAVAEGIAQVNLYSAKFILSKNGELPTTVEDLETVGLEKLYDEGDFRIGFFNHAHGIEVKAKGLPGSSVYESLATKVVPLPKSS